MIRMGILIYALLVTVSFAAGAGPKKDSKLDTKYGTDLPIMAEQMIEITAYDEETRTYEVNAVNFPGEGSTYVTPEGLAKAIGALDLKRILRSPTSIVGQQFKTDKKLPGLKDEERDLRRKAQ